MDVAALIIAVLALVIAAGSLSWQITQWLLSAGRARCVLVRAAGVEDVMKRVVGAGAEGYSSFIGVEVHNIGRAPLVVKHYGYGPRWPRKGLRRRVRGMGPMGWELGPALPHTIPPGDGATWWTPEDIVRASVPEDALIQTWIITAHDRVVESVNMHSLRREDEG